MKKIYSKRAKGGFQDNPQNINRKGRPKISITEMVKDALEEVEPKTGKTWKKLIVQRILLKAVDEGNVKMIQSIWEYIDGKPQAYIDMTSGGVSLRGLIQLKENETNNTKSVANKGTEG